jgi:hypothetical protein
MVAKVGRVIRDPQAGAYCQITLDSGEKIIVTHDKWRLTIELSKLLGFSSDTIFGCDLDSPEGRTALASLTRHAHLESAEATPLGAFVKFVKDCGTAADVKARCSTLAAR